MEPLLSSRISAAGRMSVTSRTSVSPWAARVITSEMGSPSSERRIELPAILIRSPGCTSVGATTGRPFTDVPLREPRSSTSSDSPRRVRRAWCREAKGSARARLAVEDRPTTIAPSSNSKLKGSRSAGVTSNCIGRLVATRSAAAARAAPRARRSCPGADGRPAPRRRGAGACGRSSPRSAPRACSRPAA